jgi:hypothetical protein
MDRRGFLGRLAALATAPLLIERAFEQTLEEVGTETVDFTSINDALKEAYPPGTFEALVNKESVFLKRGVEWSGQWIK